MFWFSYFPCYFSMFSLCLCSAFLLSCFAVFHVSLLAFAASWLALFLHFSLFASKYLCWICFDLFALGAISFLQWCVCISALSHCRVVIIFLTTCIHIFQANLLIQSCFQGFVYWFTCFRFACSSFLLQTLWRYLSGLFVSFTSLI